MRTFHLLAIRIRKEMDTHNANEHDIMEYTTFFWIGWVEL